jgi:alkanesulfonate monooxygenase SsuD/methylene tetrahydromethanopterin reductase-like flavin-dependent oxidoreductase (luciferase family)
MKIGIGLPNLVRDVRPSVIPRWAATAEEAGFSTVGTMGRIAYPSVMDTVALAAAAGATQRIGLVSAIMLSTAWPATLLAKEVAGIDGISGGRLTLGIGLGTRSDDFVVPGIGKDGRGRRTDSDLETYREVWSGAPVGNGDNPAVPAGTRQVPLMFGAQTPPAFARMARWGKGYIAGAVPPSVAAMGFDYARFAWRNAGRDGEPYLMAVAYFALCHPDAGRLNLGDYYGGRSTSREAVIDGMNDSPERLRAVIEEYEAIGTDELILSPATDVLDDVHKLADAVL